MSSSKVIIVKKKGGGHGGHHGGAWKVAYADFVTAMMSLFIVLWLMNANVKIRQAVAGYFNDPRGRSPMTGSDLAGTDDSLAITKDNVSQLKEKIEATIKKMNDLKSLQNAIQITITPEGLRIELLETKDGTFFDTGSAVLNKNGQELLKMLSQQLGDLPNRVGGRLWELGAFFGPCERSAAVDAECGTEEGPGVAGAWVCGPETASPCESDGPVEPEDFPDRAVCDGGCAVGSRNCSKRCGGRECEAGQLRAGQFRAE